MAVFHRDDQKVYNMVYRDGKSGRLYAKKFKVGGVTRDKEYPLFKTHSKSRVFFFAVHDSEKRTAVFWCIWIPISSGLKRKSSNLTFRGLNFKAERPKGARSPPIRSIAWSMPSSPKRVNPKENSSFQSCWGQARRARGEAQG